MPPRGRRAKKAATAKQASTATPRKPWARAPGAAVTAGVRALAQRLLAQPADAFVPRGPKAAVVLWKR